MFFSSLKDVKKMTGQVSDQEIQCQKITFSIKDVAAIVAFTFAIGFGASEYKNLVCRVDSNTMRINALERCLGKPIHHEAKKTESDKLQLTLWKKEE